VWLVDDRPIWVKAVIGVWGLPIDELIAGMNLLYSSAIWVVAQVLAL